MKKVIIMLSVLVSGFVSFNSYGAFTPIRVAPIRVVPIRVVPAPVRVTPTPIRTNHVRVVPTPRHVPTPNHAVPMASHSTFFPHNSFVPWIPFWIMASNNTHASVSSTVPSVGPTNENLKIMKENNQNKEQVRSGYRSVVYMMLICFGIVLLLVCIGLLCDW